MGRYSDVPHCKIDSQAGMVLRGDQSQVCPLNKIVVECKLEPVTTIQYRYFVHLPFTT